MKSLITQISIFFLYSFIFITAIHPVSAFGNVKWLKILKDSEKCKAVEVSKCGSRRYRKFYLTSLRKYSRGVDAHFFKENFYLAISKYSMPVSEKIISDDIREMQKSTIDFRKYTQEYLHFSERSGGIGFNRQECLINGIPLNFKLEKCRPDTLYSWGDMGKLKAIKRQLSDGTVWPESLSRQLWLTQFPSATYYYGKVGVRIKLKPNVKFKKGILECPSQKKINKMDRTSKEAFLNTVTYRLQPNPLGYLLEYVICSPNVIASWSYDRPEFYNEVVKDILWVQGKKTNEVDYGSYAYSNGKPSIKVNLNSEPFHVRWEGADGYLFNSYSLFSMLVDFKERVDSGKGEVITNLSSRELNSEHYNTAKPIYFNQQ